MTWSRVGSAQRLGWAGWLDWVGDHGDVTNSTSVLLALNSIALTLLANIDDDFRCERFRAATAVIITMRTVTQGTLAANSGALDCMEPWN